MPCTFRCAISVRCAASRLRRARAGAPGSTPPAGAGRRRGCRARSSRGRRGRASPARCAGRRRPRAGASRTSGGAGAGGRAPGSRPGVRGEPAQDQERAGAGQRAALRVQEELGPVAPVEVRPAAREVAAERLDRLAADRDDPLLAALADDAHEPVVEVDAALLEPDRLGDAQAGAVEQLDERAVAERARRDAVRGVDQPLGLARRERPRQLARPPRQLDRGGRVVGARADQLQVAEEGARRRRPPRDRRRREARRRAAGGVALELLDRRRARPACRGTRASRARSRR